MAKIKPASKEAMKAFRATLANPKDKAAFDALVLLIAAPRDDLGWHHEVGRHVAALMPTEDRRGSGWLDRLSKGLGPSPSMLRKAVRFVTLYPSVANMRPLQKLNADWTRLELTFPVEDEKQRHDLLRAAVQQRWPGQHLRFEVQQRLSSHRGGVGGRPRNKPTAHGPEVTLHELGRRSQQWVEFHADVFSVVKAKEWKAFARRRAGTDGEKPRELLRKVDASLAELAKRCNEARLHIKDMLP